MNRDYVKMLIYKYHIVKNGDGRICVRNAKNLSESAQDEIRAAKQDILTYFRERDEAVEQERRNLAIFNAIPGVAEVREVERAWEVYHMAFDRMMASGDGIMTEKLPTVRVKDVEAMYPDAVFALKIDSERTSYNPEIAAIAERAYRRIVSGEAITSVRAAYESDRNDFVDRHIWD